MHPHVAFKALGLFFQFLHPSVIIHSSSIYVWVFLLFSFPQFCTDDFVFHGWSSIKVQTVLSIAYHNLTAKCCNISVVQAIGTVWLIKEHDTNHFSYETVLLNRNYLTLTSVGLPDSHQQCLATTFIHRLIDSFLLLLYIPRTIDSSGFNPFRIGIWMTT